MTGAPLSDVRALVVEDEYYLAADLSDALRRDGATVVGPFRDAGEAIAAASRAAPTFALVDVNLGNGPDYAAARWLAAQGIPFAFVTGYGEDALPPEFADVPRVEKPANAAAIRAVAAGLAASTRR